MAEDKNLMRGMTVRDYVGENKSSYLVFKYKVNNTSEEIYRHWFEDKDSPTKRLSFSFWDAHPQMKKIVKNYILVKLYVQECKLLTVTKRLLHIKHFMEDTDFVNPDNVKDYQMIIGTWNENKRRELIAIKEFLQFSNLDHAGAYFDIVKNIRRTENSYRALPDFRGVLLFDYIVNDYWETIKDSKDRYRLFPP